MMIPQDRLLCELVHEQHDLDRWENEGGAICPSPPNTHCGRVQRRLIRHLHQHQSPEVYAGLNFAIELCEAIARDILTALTGRDKPNRLGQQQAAVARRCSKAIGFARDA